MNNLHNNRPKTKAQAAVRPGASLGNNLQSKDLNLLAVAAALFKHKNVSRAAEELGLSQSAVSHALSRLRDQFKDPLFVRASKGVMPTEFARGIQTDLLRLVHDADLLFSARKEFDPATARGRVTFATTDYFEAIVMPRLQPLIAREAPLLQISVRPTAGELPKRELEEGKIDCAIAGFYPDLPEGFFQTKLLTDTFACAVRKGHPLASSRGHLSSKDYFDAHHALITLQGDFRDQITVSEGRRKRGRLITYGSYSFTGMAWVLSESDLVLTAPRRLLTEYKKYFPISVFEAPTDVGSIDLRMVWHAQTHSNPLHTWLRKKVKEACGG